MRLLRPRLAPAAAVLLLAALCTGSRAEGVVDASAPARPALGWTAQASPFRLDFRAGDRRLVAQISSRSRGPGSSMAYDLADGSAHRLGAVISSSAVPGGRRYVVATDEPGRRATVAVRRTPRGLRVDWTLQPAAGVVRVYEAFTTRDGEHFLGAGQQGRSVDLRGRALELKVSYGCDRTIVSPFYLSSSGYGVLFRTTAVGHLQFAGTSDGTECSEGVRGATPPCPVAATPDRVQACFKASALSYEVFAGTPRQVVSRYTAAVGRPRLPPPSQFALVKWRDEVAGEAELFEDVERLRRAGIPVGWVIVDNPWEPGGCFGTLRFDAERFPDPARTFAELHRRRVKVMLWVSPYVLRRDGCSGAAGFPDDALLRGDALETSVDFTHEPAAGEWRSRLRAALALGVDGLKGDRADELDHEPDTFAAGPGTVLHNRYPSLFAREAVAELRRRGSDVATIFRAATPESIRTLNGVWGGDQPGTWAGLRAAIRMAQTAGVSGFPIWGSDIGGYHSHGLTGDVFVRWAQFAAVTPVFEVGGVGPNARFWTFGDRTVQRFRDAAVLHYELFPHLYELARRAARSGLPVVRPLALVHPADERAWRADLELLVGDDLLAAPVTSAAGGAHRVYLPAGEWVDVLRGTTHRGGRTIRRPTPLGELPLYLRAGTAIPLNARTPSIWASPWRVDDLRRAGRAGWLLAPGRQTRATATDGGSLSAVRRGGTLEVTLRRAPREKQLLVLARRAPREVWIGGRRVRRVGTAAQLRRTATGWMFTRGARGGVVVKVTRAERTTRIRLVGNS